jgi:phosphate transport system substrate-binding protein
MPILIALALGLGVVSCGQVKKTVPEGTVHIHGAGATFPNPLYQKWCEDYHKLHPEVLVEYESVGSGKGAERFLAGDVAFGASDAALTDAQIEQSPRGAQLVPTTAGAVAVVYNLPGVKTGLKLKRDVYADILLGKIAYWDDPRIQETNPDVALPKQPIVVVARQDSSGTTFAFTDHLAAISQDWKNGPGVGSKVGWPGSTMLAVGNEGVAGQVKRTTGAIGYVEYGYASRLQMATAALQNREGNFVAPSGTSGLSALLHAKLPANLRAFFPDPEGRDAYPIVTFTWMLLYRHYPDAKQGEAVKKFVNWCLHEGQQHNESLGFIRLPPAVAVEATKAVEAIRTGP